MSEGRTDTSGTGHGDDLDQGEVLRQLAEDKIVATGCRRLGPEVHAAARLLADVYTVGLTHGITPQEWAWVTDLPDACWNASRDAACRRRQTSDAEPRSKDRPTGLPLPSARTLEDRPLQAPGRSFRPPSPPHGRSGRGR